MLSFIDFNRFLQYIDFSKVQQLFVYDPSDRLYFSTSFFLFFFFFLLVFYRIFSKSKNLKIYTVIFFSLFFYYKNSGYFFLLLFASTFINFYFGSWIYKATRHVAGKKLLFISVIIIDLGILVYFKYTNFFIQIIDGVTSGNIQLLNIILPVGISFYTFKAMSYVIEIFMETMEPTNSLRDFVLYMYFFPDILAGPIDRAVAFLPQIEGSMTASKEDIGRAVFLIMSGLFKKAVIADYIGLNFVDRVFQVPLRFTGVENLLASYAFVIQIYCDFSGYTDMALGVGALLGFKLMDNFNMPFIATSIADYWRRWHISLSTWLLDYLFKPLQMSFRRMRIYGSALAIFITFLLIGFWHGANWTYLVFGLFHSTYLAVSLLTQKFRKAFYNKVHLSGTKALKIFQILITFHLVLITGIIFRSDSLKTALNVFHQIFKYFHGVVFFQWVTGYTQVFVFILIGYILHFIPKSVDNKIKNLITGSPVYVQALLLALMILILFQVESAQLQPVIYFNF
ncbi:MAG: MBOAT family O-acyltransferase [Ignavibacteriaceae bacterium]